MIGISQSEMNTWARDPRKWFILYYLGYAPAAESATGTRQLGTRIHTSLEGYYGYQLDPLLVLKAIYAIEMRGNPEAEAELRKEYALADIMISGYLEWLEETGKDANLKVVAVETDLTVPLPGVPGVGLRSRMDQVNLDETDGTLRFMDYKTADNFERHNLLELDPQMPFYSLVQHLVVAGQPNAPVVAGGQITTLRRVKRTQRAQPPFYERHVFYFNQDKVRATYNRVVRLCTEIMEARGHLDWIAQQNGATSLEFAAADQRIYDMLNEYQQSRLRPVPIISDCRWSCPLASGLCAMMDDGSDWIRAVAQGEHWKKVDPYAYYRGDALAAIRAELASPPPAA